MGYNCPLPGEDQDNVRTLYPDVHVEGAGRAVPVHDERAADQPSAPVQCLPDYAHRYGPHGRWRARLRADALGLSARLVEQAAQRMKVATFNAPGEDFAHAPRNAPLVTGHWGVVEHPQHNVQHSNSKIARKQRDPRAPVQHRNCDIHYGLSEIDQRVHLWDTGKVVRHLSFLGWSDRGRSKTTDSRKRCVDRRKWGEQCIPAGTCHKS
jgi:hypothetical protein